MEMAVTPVLLILSSRIKQLEDTGGAIQVIGESGFTVELKSMEINREEELREVAARIFEITDLAGERWFITQKE